MTSASPLWPESAASSSRTGSFDCVVTDLSTCPTPAGYDLLERMAKDEAYAFPPGDRVHAGARSPPDEEQRLRRSPARSSSKERARAERTARRGFAVPAPSGWSTLPVDRQRMLRQARDREAAFDGRKILVAEDDVRNIFALSSILEPKGAKLYIARNGREALEHLERTPDIDLVLMDIMMPEMDGLDAMRANSQKRAANSAKFRSSRSPPRPWGTTASGASKRARASH